MIAGGDAGSAGSHHGDSQSQPQVQHSSATATDSVVRSEQIAAPALPVCASTSIRRVYFCICCQVDTSSSNHAEDARNQVCT